MELKHYLAILRRRWIPFLAVPAIVGIFVLTQMAGAETSYTASAQMSVTRAPQQTDIEDFRYNEYYLFLSSEFLVDDLVEITHGNVFAEDVHQRILDQRGIDIPAGEIQGAIMADRQHRILTMHVSNADPERAVVIAQEAIEQLNENATSYFGFETEDRAALVQPIQIPESAVEAGVRDQVFWVLQILVALFAGVLLAFFLDYMDDSMHTAESVEESLDLEVIAEVPRGRVS